jgi:tetratricopeptide (TPR) repeat protein
MKSSLETNRIQRNPDVQLSIFSKADAALERAVEAFRNLDLKRASGAFSEAERLDPYLSNIQSWKNLILFLEGRERGGDLPQTLAEAWRRVPEHLDAGRLSATDTVFFDREIAGLAFRHVEPRDGFLDTGGTVHWGFLFTAIHEYEAARTALLPAIGDGGTDRADLWAGYADALWGLGRRRESAAALVRALVKDPFAVDLLRIRMPEVKPLYAKIRMRRDPRESRAVLLFAGWMEGLWDVVRPSGTDNRVEEDVMERIAKAGGSEPADRLRRFSLHFYLDRISPPGEFNIEARERMMELDAELFRAYLAKVGRMQGDMFG